MATGRPPGKARAPGARQRKSRERLACPWRREGRAAARALGRARAWVPGRSARKQKSALAFAIGSRRAFSFYKNNLTMRNDNLLARHTRHRHREHGARTFNGRQTTARKRRATLSNVLFVIGCVVAAAMVMAVFWLYTNE